MSKPARVQPSTDPTVGLMYFSPTGSTKKICEVIAAAITTKPPILLDMTKPNSPEKGNLDKVDLWVIGSPVYGGRLPLLASERLSLAFSSLPKRKTPAVAVSTYGDVILGIGLKQLVNLMAKNGFNLVGAGAFIGEHSLKKYRFATAGQTAGRPDEEDLAVAKEFGASVRLKGLNGSDISSMKSMQSAKLPFKFKLANEKSSKRFRGPIEVDASKCSKCKACVEVCPVGCIDNQTFLKIASQAENCIGCAACLKVCPEAARTQLMKLKWLAKLMGAMAPVKKRGTPVYYT